MKMIIPKKLEKGNEVRIISPSHSLSTIDDSLVKLALRKLESIGLKISFSSNCFIRDEFDSSSVKERVDDIHEAFLDKNVKAVLCARGGFNSNQLLPYMNYNIIRRNPKIFCGYSDITALNNCINKMTGIVTYAGLNFSTFRKKEMQDYNIEYFKKCLFEKESYIVKPSKSYKEYSEKKPFKNKGYFVIREGVSEGEIIGENACTFNLLQGTKYMPNLKNKILFLEEENISASDTVYMFDRELTSICQQRGFDKIKGIVIGRFQKRTGITDEKLKKIINSKKEIRDIPVIAGLDFAHTIPRFTYPIGGTCRVTALECKAELEILKH
ncbi:LD-carboxypeptidase [Candidatus Tiddalikarchaeum anstoanum]|nr:LD-carboxypeptidase [Candidatus Tiddalikarchaeum anstoanum]